MRIRSLIRVRMALTTAVLALIAGCVATSATESASSSASGTASDTGTATASDESVQSAAPTTSVVLPDSAGTSVMPPASDLVTSATSNPAALTSKFAGIPVCGSDVPPFTESTGISTPAPDTCSFPTGGSASPGCPVQPTEVVTGNETRPPAAGDRVSGSPVAGFGRFGGRGGGSMCFVEYPGGAVILTNVDQAVLLPSSKDPIRVAGRTQLARSDAIWGAVDGRIDHVKLQDSARPNGVAVTLKPVDSRVRVFVAPVSAGSVTITAFAGDGTAIQIVRQG